jgi:hypothetical protein
MNTSTRSDYSVHASITWSRQDLIQNKILVNLSIYYLNIKFLSNDILWSVMVYFEGMRKQYANDDSTYITQIGFLFEEEVIKFLKVGMKFQLSEGPTKVASGEILSIDRTKCTPKKQP